MEWLGALPAVELAGCSAEFGAAALVYIRTGSLAQRRGRDHRSPRRRLLRARLRQRGAMVDTPIGAPPWAWSAWSGPPAGTAQPRHRVRAGRTIDTLILRPALVYVTPGAARRRRLGLGDRRLRRRRGLLRPDHLQLRAIQRAARATPPLSVPDRRPEPSTASRCDGARRTAVPELARDTAPLCVTLSVTRDVRGSHELPSDGHS